MEISCTLLCSFYRPAYCFLGVLLADVLHRDNDRCEGRCLRNAVPVTDLLNYDERKRREWAFSWFMFFFFFL